jgi:hypothetical protein
MSQRWRDSLMLFALGLLINGLVAALIRVPGYTDAYYYFNGGQFIARGQGQIEPYFWNYLTASSALPGPSFSYWLPLPSILAAGGIVALPFLPPFDASQMVFILLAACLPLIGYAVGRSMGDRVHGLLAGLLLVFSGFYVIYWTLPETFTPFAVAGSLALYLAAIALQRDQAWPWIVAGMCAGLASLTRADGILLIGLLPLIGIGWKWRQQGSITKTIKPVWMLAGYFAIMSFWYGRNLMAFGSIQPPHTLDAIWLVEYNDFFNYPTNLTPARFFAAGWESLLQARWLALGTALGTWVAVLNLIVLTPLTIVGAVRRWSDPHTLIWLIYGAVLFIFMSLVFATPGMRGGYFHSGGALLPIQFTLAALGLDEVLKAAGHWRGWNVDQAARVFRPALVLIAAGLTGYLVWNSVVGGDGQSPAWNRRDSVYAEIGRKLDSLHVPPDARVISNSPPAFYYYTGRGGIPLVNGPEANLLRAAHDYGAAYLVLDQNVPDGLSNLYKEGSQSGEITLVATFGSAESPVYLYQIKAP